MHFGEKKDINFRGFSFLSEYKYSDGGLLTYNFTTSNIGEHIVG